MSPPAGSEPAVPAPAGGRPRVRFAVLAHPAVQAVRFSTKLALAWLLAPEAYGEAVLAGGLAFAAGHMALLGLDEAWVHARRPGPRLLAHLSRVHVMSGVGMAALTAAAGALLATLREDGQLGVMLMALAPMVALANLAVLPTARLTRERDWRRLFGLDVGAVLALSITTLGAAALGFGGWSLLVGWYANALVTLFLSRRAARAHPLADVPPDQEDDPTKTLRFGRHLFGAQMSAFLGDWMGRFVVGFGLGNAAVGLYAQAKDIGTVLVTWTQNLSERALYPTLSAHHREQALLPSYATALRVGLAWLLPAHLALALLSMPLVALVFPENWQAVGPVLGIMALAAGSRCLDVIAATTLKAGDLSRSVAALGALRLALMLVALSVAVVRGELLAVAVAVLVVHTLSAAVTLWRTRTQIGATADPAVRAALRATILLFLVGGPAVHLLMGELSDQPLLALPCGALSFSVLWVLSRLALDREGLVADLSALTRRVHPSPEGTA